MRSSRLGDVGRDDAVWSPDVAGRLAFTACAAARIEPTSVELIRFGTNAVYRLSGTPWILRLRRPGTSPDAITHQLSLAEWLIEHGYPANRPADGKGVVQDGLEGAVASFWEWADADAASRIDLPTFGRLLREFHTLTDAYENATIFPRWAPLDRIAHQLADAHGSSFLEPGDLSLLESWTARLGARVAEVSWELAPGLLHGDAHTGNVLVTPSGPVVIDLDLLSVGPREWDLVPTAVSSLRFGGDPQAVDGFAAAYGFDLLSWPGWPTLKMLRELYMTSWLLSVAATPERQAELRHRLDYWRAPDDRARWHAI
jgi:Ser/Thr protein kinase RdoA (MazF antagonist)